ncbi:hypothetical protein [Paraburkholderia acidiphila]|uniref:Uncharacterized protein n=1 Tax=Paraburkholderia acidiphila TaxID=2571747 RepID=A0A7Z2J9Y2_9BURK|nr:hypothetical protein [Paraburkholderia acidiphila]QGZ56856.1 hypothetical protein FAZ97_18030 [Paraburkholderia acidiphila]
MNTVTESAVTTLDLNHDDINRELADLILEDSQHASEPSTYSTNSREIFAVPELMTDEPCLVVSLPGIVSAQVPPAAELPAAIILREREDGKGDVYLQLRGGNILARSQEFGGAGRYLVLYLFDDNVALDCIPVTEELKEEIWVHEMSAQSRHPHDDKPTEESTRCPFDIPVIARRAITVVSEQSD